MGGASSIFAVLLRFGVDGSSGTLKSGFAAAFFMAAAIDFVLVLFFAGWGLVIPFLCARARFSFLTSAGFEGACSAAAAAALTLAERRGAIVWKGVDGLSYKIEQMRRPSILPSARVAILHSSGYLEVGLSTSLRHQFQDMGEEPSEPRLEGEESCYGDVIGDLVSFDKPS
jgi:hypothetical protein